MTEWQPIETAPIHKLILLFEPHCMGGFMFVGCTDVSGKRWVNNLDMLEQKPTHWMSIPEAPQ